MSDSNSQLQRQLRHAKRPIAVAGILAEHLSRATTRTTGARAPPTGGGQPILESMLHLYWDPAAHRSTSNTLAASIHAAHCARPHHAAASQADDRRVLGVASVLVDWVAQVAGSKTSSRSTQGRRFSCAWKKFQLSATSIDTCPRFLRPSTLAPGSTTRSSRVCAFSGLSCVNLCHECLLSYRLDDASIRSSLCL